MMHTTGKGETEDRRVIPVKQLGGAWVGGSEAHRGSAFQAKTHLPGEVKGGCVKHKQNRDYALRGESCKRIHSFTHSPNICWLPILCTLML